ncbi:MAG: malate dehydrogenase [Muribaculaceae bacterium]|nr:malate dehydrogenase [Muribaculaceae bacterium]
MEKGKLESAALAYHKYPHPGKIEIIPTKPYDTPEDLSLAYSPGVAYPCLEIEKNSDDIYDYTNKGNLVAVISNGTAVLGLGDIGADASKPVMEGKALLFKIFAGLDSFDIEIDEKDPKEFIKTVKRIAPTFGGINLEDIKAPECFEIETTLRDELDIPIMHDDQHGTAIITSAALLNALLIQDKKIEDIRLVVNGAGAAAVSCTRLFCSIGVKRENIVMCDSKGVIRADRENLNSQKREFATTRDLHTLAEAMKDADVFLGLSKADVVTPDMILSMAQKPIVFALANPSPEIAYEVAVATRPDLIFATGRSDYPNQINNVLGFPYIFRGALDCRASSINEEMKVGAAKAIAALARQSVPESISKAYGKDLRFGKDYILPKPFDRRLLTEVAPAVVEAAEASGVARRKIDDMEAYRASLSRILERNDGVISRFIADTK